MHGEHDLRYCCLQKTVKFETVQTILDYLGYEIEIRKKVNLNKIHIYDIFTIAKD